jgi:hypothetical protein
LAFLTLAFQIDAAYQTAYLIVHGGHNAQYMAESCPNTSGNLCVSRLLDGAAFQSCRKRFACNAALAAATLG